MPANYYLVLGVAADSTQQDIKAAYRRLAKESHPDLCHDRQAFFLRIQEAYAVLGDPARRQEYDETMRAAGRKAEPHRQGPAPHRRAPSPDRVEPLIPERQPAFAPSGPHGGEGYRWPDADIAAVFARLSGGFAGRGQGGTVMEVALTPQQAMRGGILRLPVSGIFPCPACGGSGEGGFFATCSRCGGTGARSCHYPLRIEFPPGLLDDSVLRVPLGSFGSRSSWLSIRFRIQR